MLLAAYGGGWYFEMAGGGERLDYPARRRQTIPSEPELSQNHGGVMQQAQVHPSVRKAPRSRREPRWFVGAFFLCQTLSAFTTDPPISLRMVKMMRACEGRTAFR